MGGRRHPERGTAARAVRRPGDRPDETGRGHRRQQHPGHHARRPADHRAGPRRRRADLRRRRHATPHTPIDTAALGADFYATSSYKWSGPHIGAVTASPDLLERLSPDKLASSPPEVLDRFETGTLPFADLARVTAAVDHLAGLDPDATGTRRERLLASMAAVEAHEQAKPAHLLKGLSALPGVGLVGSPPRRTATAFFTVAGHTPPGGRAPSRPRGQRVDGHWTPGNRTQALGIRDAGSGAQAGLAHWTLQRSDMHPPAHRVGRPDRLTGPESRVDAKRRPTAFRGPAFGGLATAASRLLDHIGDGPGWEM